MGVALLVGVTALNFQGCSSRVAEKKAYTVVRVDTLHGIAYPYEFTRARDLIDNGLYEAAAYDYVILYPTFKDSVIHESLRMDSTLQVNHANHSVVYYLKQCVVGEMMQDPDVKHDSVVDEKALHRRYTAISDLLYDLEAYGIK